jgi:hypothetical protein
LGSKKRALDLYQQGRSAWDRKGVLSWSRPHPASARHVAVVGFCPDFDTVIAKMLVSEARREVFVTTQVG